MTNIPTGIKNAAQTEANSAVEPNCAKCGTRLSGKQGWCRRCGWYPLLNTFVELDAHEQPALNVPAMRASKLTKLRKKITRHVPGWAWNLSAGFASILVASLLARFLLPGHGPARFIWTVSELVIGIAALVTGQILCYMFAIVENDRLMVLDIVLRPITIWIAVARELPATFWRLATTVWGLTLIIGALLVGGFADRDLWDWGGDPVKPRLLQAIAAHARHDEDKVAGTLKKLTDDGNKKANKNESVDCLILGFVPEGPDDFGALILASEVDGSLKYVGMVRNGIKPDVRAQLNKRMRQLIQPEPFLATGMDGVWIKPELLCRVSVLGRSSSNKLVEPTFKELLSDMMMAP